MAKKSALRLEGDLTIHHAQALLAQLREQLAAKHYRLELSGVTDCDMSGIQLLLLFARQAREAGKTLDIMASSDVIRHALGLLQLDRHLQVQAR